MKTHWDGRGLVDDLVARGVDDWIDLGLVLNIARRVVPEAGEGQTALAIGIVAVAIAEGLVVAGEVREGGFEPWSMSAEDALTRLIQEWHWSARQ